MQNYEGFLHSYVDARGTETFYARSFPDKYVPEVLFLVRTPHRAKAVNEAMRQWRQRCAAQTCASRALTIEEASIQLLAVVGSRSTHEQKCAPVAADGRPGTVVRFYEATSQPAKARAWRQELSAEKLPR